MSEHMPEWMYTVYSRPRLAPYIARCGGDTAEAAELYNWNVTVSAAFYHPLHVLELAARNSMHDRLTDHFGQADWWNTTWLLPQASWLIDQARRNRLREGSPVAPDDIVTDLSFGFWTWLLVSRYDRSLWRTALHHAFPQYHGRRDELHKQLNHLRKFRNRIVHHEPVHHLHLEAYHRSIYRVLSWISTDAATGITPLDRVPEVLMARGRTAQGRPASSV